MKHDKIFVSALVVLIASTGAFISSSILNAQTSAPATPVLDSVTPLSACRAQLKWTSGPADSFVMSVNDGRIEITNENCGTSKCYNHDYRNPGRPYKYKVAARFATGGTSDWSNEISVTMLQVPIPSAPVWNVNSWDGGLLSVSWNASSDLVNGGYRIFHSTNGTDFTQIDHRGTDSLKYTAPASYTADSPHYFKINAFTTGEGCDVSDITSENLGLAKLSLDSKTFVIPAQPKNLKNEVVQRGSDWGVKFSWDKVASATKYNFQVSFDESFSSLVTDKPITGTEYTETFSEDQAFYWRVQSINESSGLTGKSPFVVANGSAGWPKPTNAKAEYYFDPVNPPKAGSGVNVKFSWKDLVSIQSREAQVVITKDSDKSHPTVVILKDAHPDIVPPLQTHSFTAISGERYELKVRIELISSPDTAHSEFSETVVVDLRPTVVKKEIFGNAWSKYNSGTAGIGWISLNYEEKDGGTQISSVPYRLVIDTNNNLLGAAWAYKYGWLSFNSADLSGCPDGKCYAKYDATTGKVTGWARFIGFNIENSFGWGGWVQLRGATTGAKATEYGLCIGSGSTSVSDTAPLLGDTCSTAKGFFGTAWAGDKVGWITFAGTVTPDAEEPDEPEEIAVNPPGPLSIAIFEQIKFKADQDVEWSVVGDSVSSAVKGGNSTLGTITPETSAGAEATFTAPSTIGKKVFIVAKKGDKSSSPVEVNIGAPYDLVSCLPYNSTSENIIKVAWRARFNELSKYNSYAKHSLSLCFGESPKDALECSSVRTVAAGSSGDFDHGGRELNTDYYYALRSVYTKNGPATTVKSGVLGPCSVFIPKRISDAPSRTKVFGNSDNTIYINWKDNATTTEPYHFEIQRIKVTPVVSTDFEVRSRQDYVELKWKNSTISTPYYFVIERSSSNKKEKFTEGNFDRILVDGHNLPMVPTGEKQFVYTDYDVKDGASYSYRIKTCSTIDLSKAYTSEGDIKGGKIAKPAEVCSKYTPDDEVGVNVVAYNAFSDGVEENDESSAFKKVVLKTTDTVRNVVSTLFRKNNEDERSGSYLGSLISGTGDVLRSAGEKATEIFDAVKQKVIKAVVSYAEAVEEKFVQPSSLSEYFSAFTAETNFPVYKDTELEPDTVYIYRLRTVYDSGVTTDWDTLGAAKTLRDVLGDGVVGGGAVCTRNSYCDFSIKGYASSPDETKDILVEKSEKQCNANSDCRDVGRAGQVYEER